MSRKAFQAWVLAAVMIGFSACGPSTDPSYQKIGPLTPDQRGRFERTAQLVGEVTQWKTTTGVPPSLAEEPPQMLSQGEKKAEIFRQLGERCKFANEIPPDLNPTPTPLPPAPDKPKTSVIEKGVVAKKKGDLDCPISFQWKQQVFDTLDQASVRIKQVTTEEMKFAPESSDAKGGLNVQKYISTGKFEREKKGDKEILNGSGKGTLALILDNTLQTVVVSMRAWGMSKDGASELTLSYYFVYGDGMRVELKSFSKNGAAPVFTINEAAIEQKDFEAYLSKFGVPAKVP